MNWYKHAQVQRLSLQDALDRKMFGPVYHGTSSDSRQQIDQEGFKIFEGEARSGQISHGYENTGYGYGSCPPPVHHLGYGIYFTTSKKIATDFNYGTARGIKTYYLEVPRLGTINFGSTNTMMKWWVQNGYNCELAKTDRVAATQALTQNLKSQYDAVWFKGKGLYRLLDGDQICVFDTARIYEIDKNLSQPGQSGAKVQRKSDGMKGVILDKKSAEGILQQYPGASSWLNPETKWIMTVKWNKGGTKYNVQDVDVIFL